MLEMRTYTKMELNAMFGNGGFQGLQRKLTRYGVEFACKGRGERRVFDILKISDPFKIFCITELDFDGGTDFRKLRNFYYYFFNDDEFRNLPDEEKEYRMEVEGNKVSRQTITKYIEKLSKKDFISCFAGEYVYYFARRRERRIATQEEYSRAWKEYWEIRDTEGYRAAIGYMIAKHGGVAKKHATPVYNVFYLDKLELLQDLIVQSLEYEIDEQN